MSRKCGITWAKLNSGAGGTKHKGNDKAFMCEAFEERWSADPDLDRTKTKDNVYMTGYRSGLELLNDINHEIAEYNQQLKNSGKRGLRKDAITSFAVIVKPDMEVMGELTKEQQIKFFEDAYNLISEKLGTNPDTNVPNVRGGVIQFDEGNPHLHLFGVPYNNKGKLCADDIFRLPLNRWLNETFPKLMSQKGWNLEPCKDPEGYDPDKAKTMNEQQLKEYKEQCIEYKRSKKKQHGQSAIQHKINSEIEKRVDEKTEELQQEFDEAFADKEQEIEQDFTTIETEKKNIRNREKKFKEQVEEQTAQIRHAKKVLIDKKQKLDDRETALDTREADIKSLEAHTELLNRQAREKLDNLTKLPNDDYSKYAMGWMKQHGYSQQCFNDYCIARGLNDSFTNEQEGLQYV